MLGIIAVVVARRLHAVKRTSLREVLGTCNAGERDSFEPPSLDLDRLVRLFLRYAHCLTAILVTAIAVSGATVRTGGIVM
jgi:hypothetical protein